MSSQVECSRVRGSMFSWPRVVRSSIDHTRSRRRLPPVSGRRRGPAGLMQDSDHDPLQGRGMHFHFTARLSSSSERTSSLSLYVDLTHTDATGQISRLEGLVQDGRARDPPFHLHLAAHFGILKAFSKRVLPLSSHQHTFEFINLSSLSAMPPSTFGDSTTAAEAAALFAASIVGKVILVTGASIGGLGGETARDNLNEAKELHDKIGVEKLRSFLEKATDNEQYCIIFAHDFKQIQANYDSKLKELLNNHFKQRLAFMCNGENLSALKSEQKLHELNARLINTSKDSYTEFRLFSL